MERQNEIRREIVIDAPIERVWEAITSAEQVSQWFGDVCELKAQPGSRARFGWSDFGDVFEAEVITVEKPVRFAYRWALEEDKTLEESPNTLVQFILEHQGDMTRLTLVESGFSSLPDEIYQQHLEENSNGWDAELADLQAFLAGVRPVA